MSANTWSKSRLFIEVNSHRGAVWLDCSLLTDRIYGLYVSIGNGRRDARTVGSRHLTGDGGELATASGPIGAGLPEKRSKLEYPPRYRRPERPAHFLFADKPLVTHVPKDGRVQLTVACRKRDKWRQSGHRGQ